MIKYRNIIDWAKPVYVACSGGIDSIAVAHFFRNKNITLYHHNHNLRSQNDEMECSVKRFAKDFNIKYCSGKSSSGLQSEADCRDSRLEFYDKLQGQIVLAHHLDDCIESYLMNCFNGTPEYCPIPIVTKLKNSTIVRPFLLTKKSDFQDYINTYELENYIIEDETNINTKIRRNWIRHVIIPKIEEHYPGLSKVVFKKVVKTYAKIGN